MTPTVHLIRVLPTGAYEAYAQVRVCVCVCVCVQRVQGLCTKRRLQSCVLPRVARFGLFEAKKQILAFILIRWPRNFC